MEVVALVNGHTTIPGLRAGGAVTSCDNVVIVNVGVTALVEPGFLEAQEMGTGSGKAGLEFGAVCVGGVV